MSQSLPTTTLAIFGVTGDLSRRKLLPALSEICLSSDIRAHLKILGLSRRDTTAQAVLTGQSQELSRQFELLRMDYTRAGDYQKLKDKLDELGSEQVIFYLAIPPDGVLPIVKQLGEAGLNSSKFKLLMEKPFGTDLSSAQQLIDETHQYFSEEQVYRIDHFLAKEMAQNITVFLGSNAIFRDVWNNRFIERIEVLAEESLGIEGRVELWESTGTLRDFVQSHLMQLTALTLMEPCPDVFDFSMVQPRRLAALQSLELSDAKDSVIKGQYEGYRSEVKNPGSNTETFVALELKSTTPKWQGVPIRLVTGKKLSQKLTEIRVHFKRDQSSQTNMLKLRIQPKEAVELELWVKKPGYDQDLQKLPLDFNYQQYFDKLPDAYEQVIVDAVRSRTNLFASGEEVLASWKVLQPLLDDWQRRQSVIYKPGSAVKQILSSGR
jgi:glucose-6-phosphate 1-dehydrogenase